MDSMLRIIRRTAIVSIYLCFLTFPIMFANKVYFSVEYENSYTYNVPKQTTLQEKPEQKGGVIECFIRGLTNNINEVVGKTIVAVFLSLLITYKKPMKIGTI